MSQELQTTSQSPQLSSDLIKKLRHAFHKEATDQIVSLLEFNRVFNRVFSGISDEKYTQIFNSYDQESKGTINYLSFLKHEQLPNILLSIHNEALSSPMTLLHSDESYNSDTTLYVTDNEQNIGSGSIQTLSPNTPCYDKLPSTGTVLTTSYSESASQPFNHIKQKSSLIVPLMSPRVSYESSLEQEVHQKDTEINKLKEWITNNAIPAQESVSELQQKVKHVQKRETEMCNEVKQMEASNKSLKIQITTLLKRNQELETQHTYLLDEHKSLKNLCNEIQKNYEESMVNYNKEKEQNKNSVIMLTDLRKLKDQYEQVNSDQAKKIESYKEDMNQLREKYALLELSLQEITQENGMLAHYINSGMVTTETMDNNEHKEANPLKINLNAGALSTNAKPAHPVFQPSVALQTGVFDTIARRYSTISNGTARLTLASNNSVSSSDYIEPTPYTPNASGYHNIHRASFGTPQNLVFVHNPSTSTVTTPNVVFDDENDYSTLYGGDDNNMNAATRRTMTAAAINQLLDSDDSQISGNDDDLDDVKSQETTGQIQKYLQEEMESDLKEEMQREYDLKIMKFQNEYNEKLLKLQMENDDLKVINKKQLRKIRIVERASSALQPLNYMVSSIVKLKNDATKQLDDIIPDGSDESVNSSISLSQSVSSSCYTTDDDQCGDGHNDNDIDIKKAKKKRDKKYKKYKKYTKYKKEDIHKKSKGMIPKTEIIKSRFCCSSIFGDGDKTEYDMEQNLNIISVKSESSKKHHHHHKKKKNNHKHNKSKKKHKHHNKNGNKFIEFNRY